MLKLFDFRWLMFIMLLTVAALPVRTNASTPTIVISEIAWAGSSSSASDEWIELTNVSDTAVDLSGWKLTGVGSSGAELVLPDGAQIEPHSTYMIANYEHTHENSALESAPQYVTTTLSLSNNGFSLALSDALGTVMDVAGGIGAPFAGRSGGTGDAIDGRYASMVRGSGLGDGSLEESWEDADTSSGFKTGVQDLGTPGSVVFATAVVIPSDSEGSLNTEVAESSGDPSSTDETRQDDTDVTEAIQEEPATEESIEELVVEEMAVEDVIAINIVINEFVVDPLGDGVEWIELYNVGESSATLEGWSIEDTAGQSTDLSTVTIEAGGYALVEEPTGKLNNDGDSIILKDATGAVVESVIYGDDGYDAPKDGDALARNGETFEITQEPTPGSGNVIVMSIDEVLVEEETVEETTIQEETTGDASVEEVAVEEIQIQEESSSSVIPPAHQSLGDGGSETSEIEGSQVVVEATEEVELLKTLRFVTLYPNATGSDEEEEYIVIENNGTNVIDLVGWSIEDGSTKSFTFQDSTNLAPRATMNIDRPQSNLTLNNGGDTLELIAPDGEVVDLVTYGTSAKGATYDLVDGTWAWSGTATIAEVTATELTTTSTPVVATPTTPSTTSAVSNSTNTTTSTSSPAVASTKSSTASVASARVGQFVTIAQAKEKSDGQYVTLKGVVTSVPGTFGNQIFYIQDETGGIQVYLYSGDFPEIAVGDIVQVNGELSTSRGERRVKLASASGVVSASGTYTSQPIEIAVSDIDESLIGLIMKTQGLVQSIDTNKLVLEQTGATLVIYLKSNPTIDAQQFERGEKMEVTGVLTSYDGELRLRPRIASDISVVEEAIMASAVITESSSGSSAGMVLFMTTIAALIALALWRYLPRRRLTPSTA